MLSHEEIHEILIILSSISDASFICKLGDTSTKKVEVLPVEIFLVEVIHLEVMDRRSIACRSKYGRSNG